MLLIAAHCLYNGMSRIGSIAVLQINGQLKFDCDLRTPFFRLSHSIHPRNSDYTPHFHFLIPIRNLFSLLLSLYHHLCFLSSFFLTTPEPYEFFAPPRSMQHFYNCILRIPIIYYSIITRNRTVPNSLSLCDT